MITICKKLNIFHGLQYSTDPSPLKSKTKCICFPKPKVEPPKLMLCGNFLPWVDSIVHLGTTILNDDSDILKRDMDIKRSQYINRSNKLLQ